MKLLSLSDVDQDGQAHQEQPTIGSSRVVSQLSCLALQFDPSYIWSLQFKCPELRATWKHVGSRCVDFWDTGLTFVGDLWAVSKGQRARQSGGGHNFSRKQLCSRKQGRALCVEAKLILLCPAQNPQQQPEGLGMSLTALVKTTLCLSIAVGP